MERREVLGPYTDVASGSSDRRVGLARALDACARAEVSEVVVTHPERLARLVPGPLSACSPPKACRSW